MTPFILAQIIGFAGYLFYSASPHFKTQNTIMQIGMIGYLLLCAQWYLLAQPALLVINILALLTSAIALKAKTNKNIQKLMPTLYPIGILALLYTSHTTLIDALCIGAFTLSIASKSAQDISKFRIYAFCSGTLLALSGALALSIPAFIFNTLFTIIHIQKHVAQTTATQHRTLNT